ncbi:MAG TPA: glycine cleavage system protein H [Anaeromyxobacteraceae bacterium]|nr:glycine cleavage system protein H [Anaeromyxobacteraceae bacterium]
MSPPVEVLETLAAFLLGLLLRMGVVVLFVAAILLPVVFVLGLVRLYRIARPAMRGLRRAGRALYKPGLRYAEGHTWIEREEGRLKLGLDGVAQEILPWALGVELPGPGARLAEGDTLAVISCGATEARFASPVAGTVLEVNPAVVRDPSLVKEDGYGRGWLLTLAPSDARWSTLLADEVARKWVEDESDRLEAFLEERLGFEGLASRAGPAPKQLVGTDWQQLVRSFLHA